MFPYSRPESLQLKLDLGFKWPPGSELSSRNTEYDEMENWPGCIISMVVPNEVERVRREFAPGVDVVWDGEIYRKAFDGQREVLSKQGWDVVGEKEALFPREPESYVDYVTDQTMFHPQSPSICYSLRRRHLVVKL
jgi:hypothetical protein